MKLFLDTSSLFKLYHTEIGTAELDTLLSQQKITHLFLSELSKVEFSSTVWKKVRMNEITHLAGQQILIAFEEDYSKYIFIPTDSLIIEQAKNLLYIHGTVGLRSLDAIQLSTCLALRHKIDLFYTHDNLLRALLNTERLRTEL